MRSQIFVLCGFLLSVCKTQHNEVNSAVLSNSSLHSGLSEKIGNFSIELLYHTTLAQERTVNLILSPFTVWTVLAVISEGAAGNTLNEIAKALRINPKFKETTRRDYQGLAKWLEVKTDTIDLQKLNALFMDQDKVPQKDFLDVSVEYNTRLIPANFSNADLTAKSINSLISSVTHGRIPKLVNTDDINNSNLILTSALYFKGRWTIPFNSSLTQVRPFFDSSGKKLGEVNMMYNLHQYPYANIKALQANIVEIPYGKSNRLSMLIILPNRDVTLNDMFYNFGNVSLDMVFDELKISKEDFSEDQVEFYLPRFKIESSLELTNALRSMGIFDLFNERNARLPLMSYVPVHVSRMIHKAEIEVTEEGTTASAASAADFSNRMGNIKFEANRPFCYLIVEKITNSIVFGGFYHTPSLY